MIKDYAISLTATEGDFVFLSSIPVVAPLTNWKPYSKLQSLGDGGERYAGWPITTMYWAGITLADREFFRTYCPGRYAKNIYINTLNDDDVWVTALTNMFWMRETEDWAVEKSLGFTLTYKVKSFAEIA